MSLIQKRPYRAITSSRIVIGMSLILAISVSILAAFNYKRERQGMQQVLNEKGAALIKSFEAGMRTGMMGRFGSGARLQTLLSETASLDDILYIVLVDEAGKILAHNDPTQIETVFTAPQTLQRLDPKNEIDWRTVDQAGRPVAFEVFRKFLPDFDQNQRQPMHGHMRHQNGTFRCQPGWLEGLPQDRILNPESRPVIFIGMDATPYTEAMKKDFWRTLVISAVTLLLGIVGVVSLFWAQSHSRSKKLLQDSRAFASEMVANLPEGIIVTDPKRTITFINDIALEMLGLDFEGTVNQPIENSLPGSLRSLVELISSDQKIVEKELRLPSSDDTELISAVTATDIISEDGDFVGTMIILRDLSQIRRLQATVQKQEKLAAIGNLAAGVAHEVRNPLSSIKGYATYFGSLFAEDSEQKQAAEIMTSEVERLNRVISELLELSRPSDLKRKQTDIALLVTSSLRLVQQETETAGITVDTTLGDDLTLVAIDPDRITQSLINLYINAIQAMPDGGTLSLRVFSKEDGTELHIRDTGNGMSPEIKNKIFDPYFTTKSTGTGLGLAVVQKIIEAHGGTIQVTSNEGEGTCFSIFLPCNSETEINS